MAARQRESERDRLQFVYAPFVPHNFCLLVFLLLLHELRLCSIFQHTRFRPPLSGLSHRCTRLPSLPLHVVRSLWYYLLRIFGQPRCWKIGLRERKTGRETSRANNSPIGVSFYSLFALGTFFPPLLPHSLLLSLSLINTFTLQFSFINSLKPESRAQQRQTQARNKDKNARSVKTITAVLSLSLQPPEE